MTPAHCVGCTYLWCGCLTIPLLQIMLQTHALFVIKQKIKNKMKYLTEKNIKYADLVVPFIRCPFEEPETDCPFKVYWELPEIEERIQAMGNLSEDKLENLREHHRQCILNQVTRIQKKNPRTQE